MRVGIISVYMDFHRKGAHHRGVLQPQIGPLIAALLPPDIDVEVMNDTWEDPDWTREYDLLFISSLHSDFDRARQISHYWRRRGAKTVFGGTLASTYPGLCKPFFDSIVIGDPESTVPQVYRDFSRGTLEPVYLSAPYDPLKVPVPRFDLLANKQVVPLSLEATRGCPFSCDFCALTAVGTRHLVRPPELIARDIREGQQMLEGLVAWHKRRLVVFCDNNIGGNLSHLRQLCEALTPLNIRWGSAATFNVVANRSMVKELSRSGCRFMFVGLESFNPEAIADMNKYQNALHKTRRVLDECRDHGILIVAGLMLSPLVDDVKYIRTIPERLKESGLHVPSFVCFECPIPGTPNFRRLASSEPPAFLPNALLRDFNGYTLVTKPQRESLDDFVGAYKQTLDTVYSKETRFRKLADDLTRFIAKGWPFPALIDTVDQLTTTPNPLSNRTYVSGTDVVPPEATSVPLTNGDFDSLEEQRAIMEPWRVSDAEGRVLPLWRDSTVVFEPKGRVSAKVLKLWSAG